MREPTYYVLAALLAGPLHGYAIIQQAADLSGGRVRLETVNGRLRRSYGLTGPGASALRAEAQRMAEAAALVISPSDSPATSPIRNPRTT
jgi:PadR family transcriptional regulator